jgi:TIR domain-containing protein
MPDIFLSYAREDRVRARKLARALEGCGWEVWWDEHIPAGDNFDRAIEQTLPRSTCVVVLWSSRSVDSDFVRAEARWAAKHGRLIPVSIDRVDLPIEFSAHQALDLVRWPKGSTEGYDRLAADLRHRIAKGNPPKPAARERRSIGFGSWSIGVAVLGLWPILASNLGGGDDPFIVAPMVIAGGLLVLSLLKPIAPNTGLVFAIVPCILNLFAYYLFYERSVAYHFQSAGIVVDAVAVVGGLIVVYAICKQRVSQGDL